MLGVDDRLVTPATMKWVRVGLIAGIATMPMTILLYYVLGLAVDAAWQGSNLLRQWFWVLAVLVLAKAVLAWVFRTGQFRASSEAKLNVRDRIHKKVVELGPGLLGKRRTGEIANIATEGVEYLDYYFSVYFVQIWVAIAIPVMLCAAIFWIDWVVGLWMLAGVPLTPLFVGSSARGFRRINAQNEDVKNRNSSQYLDSIQGMTTLKMFNREKSRGREMEAGNEAQRRTTMKLLAVAQSQFVFLELGFALFSTAVAMAVALYRYSGGHVSPGEVLAVVLISLEFSRTLLLIGEFFFAGALGREVARTVREFLDEKAPVRFAAEDASTELPGDEVSIRIRGRVLYLSRRRCAGGAEFLDGPRPGGDRGAGRPQRLRQDDGDQPAAAGRWTRIRAKSCSAESWNANCPSSRFAGISPWFRRTRSCSTGPLRRTCGSPGRKRRTRNSSRRSGARNCSIS